MNKEAEQIIADWNEYNMNAVNRLVAIGQAEVITGILTRLNPNNAVLAPCETQEMNLSKEPKKSIAELEAERQARKGNPKPTVKVYTNPADDPNYGMMGYAAAEGGAGAIVTDVVEEEQAV